jgi:hypothetical protein
MWIDTRKFEQPGLPAICKSIETLQQVLESLGISDDQVDTENDEVLVRMIAALASGDHAIGAVGADTNAAESADILFHATNRLESGAPFLSHGFACTGTVCCWTVIAFCTEIIRFFGARRFSGVVFGVCTSSVPLFEDSQLRIGVWYFSLFDK